MNNRIELLKKLLEENKDVSDYKINRTNTLSSELFFVHRTLETSRATDVCDTGVTVYVDHDGKKGESAFAVYESMTETDLKLKIAEAAARAKLVFNEPSNCDKDGCDQFVDVRIGKMQTPLIDQNTTGGNTNLGNLLPRMYWLDTN